MKRLILFLSYSFLLCSLHITAQVNGKSNALEANGERNMHITLLEAYAMSKCGLNYSYSAITLDQRGGSFNPSSNQPASLIISGIPTGAVIEQAFLYYSIEDYSSNSSAFLFDFQNPDGVTSSLNSQPLAFGPSACWGTSGSATFRNDVTSLITGNGAYVIDNFPISAAFPISTDTNGAALIIIYSDPSANYVGNLHMLDGHEVSTVNSMDIITPVTGYLVGSTVTSSTGFMIFADDQDFVPNSIFINGVNIPFTDNDAFVYAEGPINLTSGQSNSQHILDRGSDDCISLSMTGVYYQESDISICVPPGIPTLGEWSLIVLCLLLLIVGLVSFVNISKPAYRLK